MVLYVKILAYFPLLLNYFIQCLKFNLFYRYDVTKYICLLYLVIRQRNFLRAKFGGGEDETQDDDDGDEEDDKHILGGRRSAHGADIHNIEVRV